MVMSVLPAAYAQNINFAELKKLKRDSIIQLGLFELKEKGILLASIDTSICRVMANSKMVYILFCTEFKYDPEYEVLNNYDVKLEFLENDTIIYPYGYDPKSEVYLLTEKQKETIKAIYTNSSIPFAEDENVRIVIFDDHYEMTISRQHYGGAECYKIDKKTNEWQMMWHEHPNPNHQGYDVDESDDFIEIK